MDNYKRKAGYLASARSRFWPTTAKQVNEQSDTHAVGIYNNPQKRA